MILETRSAQLLVKSLSLTLESNCLSREHHKYRIIGITRPLTVVVTYKIAVVLWCEGYIELSTLLGCQETVHWFQFVIST